MEVILFDLSGAAWLALEVGLLVRDRVTGQGGTARDRGTLALNLGLIVLAVIVADILSSVVPKSSPWHIPGAGSDAWLVPLAIIWIGLLLRLWSIVVLGRSFRMTVEVDAGQRVVSRGPYRLVRHPSYTGLLLVAIGFGLAEGTWPGLALCVVLPVVAMLIRIHVEEAELARVLGEPYREYQGHTKRLIPGIW